MPGLLEKTRVVMVHPFFPENVGAAARAMKNCGLKRLLLVGGIAPDHPNCLKLAVGSEEVLEEAEIVESLEEALEGVSLSFASTSHAYRNFRPLPPREAAALASSQNGEVALVFGNEKNGLKKREIALCHQMIQIPSAVPDASLNLSQAIMICAYEWQNVGLPPEGGVALSDLASESDLSRVKNGLNALLEKTNFYAPHHAARNRAVLNRVLTRIRLDDGEAKIFLGLVERIKWALDQAAKQPV
ncbi:MAG TPA: TrmJ/YjtD family RNA methyltransferase [Chroococcales cyanobacterium]|jgi:TrmH family RNA methyltransferase